MVTTTSLDRDYLEAQGYKLVMPRGDDMWVAIYPFIFTVAIITGTVDEQRTGYSDRWCYNSMNEAIDALGRWALTGFDGEPSGWHRHPSSGRRRPNGAPDEEYVNP